MTNRIQCKACGLYEAELRESVETYTAPYGTVESYTQRTEFCSHCGIEIDVSESEAFPLAIQASEAKSVPLMIEGIVEHCHISKAGIERAFDLPERLVSNWVAKKKISKGGMALLRTIRSFPWIVGVADRNFNPIEVDRINGCIHLSGAFDQSTTFIDRRWDLVLSHQVPDEYMPNQTWASASASSGKNEVVIMGDEGRTAT
jgi:hypothetical protein